MRLINWDALIKEAGKLWTEMPDGEELSKELMKAINHAPTVATDTNVPGKWINVKDRIPENGQQVVAFCDDGFCEVVNFEKTMGRWWGPWGWYPTDRITHWMPLPEPPEEVSGDG